MSILDIAATGMQSTQKMVDILADNIANINTNSFKELKPQFEDLIYLDERRPGEYSSDQDTIYPAGIQVGLGSRIASVYRLDKQGDLIETNNNLDVAIKGIGYLRVLLPNGEYAYTRDGTLSLNPQGEIVNNKGYVISPGITIPTNALKITINPVGEVYVDIPGQIQPQLVGQFDLVAFINPKGLYAMGDNMFSETIASGPPQVEVAEENNMGSFLQGWLESSNVNPITQITMLIKAQRAYELCSNFVQAGGEILKEAIQSRR